MDRVAHTRPRAPNSPEFRYRFVTQNAYMCVYNIIGRGTEGCAKNLVLTTILLSRDCILTFSELTNNRSVCPSGVCKEHMKTLTWFDGEWFLKQMSRSAYTLTHVHVYAYI